MKTNRVIKIFLASSEELEADRYRFGNLIRKLDNIYEKRGIRIELFEWEDYDAAYNGMRKQDEYNERVRASDMFLALFRFFFPVRAVPKSTSCNATTSVLFS